MSTSPLVRDVTPVEFFREQLEKALEHQRVATSAFTEFYLVNLLAGLEPEVLVEPRVDVGDVAAEQVVVVACHAIVGLLRVFGVPQGQPALLSKALRFQSTRARQRTGDSATLWAGLKGGPGRWD